jgi:diguanylate cyclase (GGDEF)-like protein
MNPSLLPPWLGVLMVVSAAYVSFELSHRARHRDTAQRNAWLMATSVALCCGIWCSQVLALCAALASHGAGFHPGIAIAAALAALGLCLAGLNLCLTPAPGWPQVIAAAAILAAASLAAQIGLLMSIGLKPHIEWSLGRLAFAWLACAVGFLVALITFLPLDGTRSLRPRPRQLAAASIAGLAVLSGQSLTIAASGMAGLVTVDDANLVAAGQMAAVASMGGAQVLLLLLLACLVELRLRSSLDAARGERQADSFRDGLTRLPTRSTFEGTLAQALQMADTRKASVVLLHIALDGFKHVNDNFGHQAGDAVLKCIAKRLRVAGPPHRVARLGGDEFLMLLDGEDAATQAKVLAARLLESIAQPCHVDGRDHGVTCSIGLAVYPQHGAMSSLITHASIATRASKSAGGATYSFFDPRMVNEVREQAELLRDLRQALLRGQLELYYQPKIHAPSAQVTAAEALLRWHHPQRGMISPTVFIPLAERSGLIDSLGAWVIDEACRQARVWRDQGMRMRVAVNLSVHQLRRPELPGHIAAALSRHQINPDLLTCEITESVAMEDTVATMRFFTELAAVGVHISIDDFGAGYSSLAYLRKLPATELKIDRSFVLDLEHSEDARTIAEAVVNLAQALNMKVVAEGVETDAQYQILRRMGCEHVQGFLFAKPMSAKSLALWAMGSDGPRSIQFRESLFKETQALTT